jgi:stage V sporulation protein AA
MDIYIKPETKVDIIEKQQVHVVDIADVYAPDQVAEDIKKFKVLQIPAKEKANYLISILDIIKRIKIAYPEAVVFNVGETETIVAFYPKPEKKNPIIHGLLIAFVSLTLLSGSATAIMSFHTDAQMPKVFQNFYKIFFNEEIEQPLIIDIPYSIGLASGIILFFNHFCGKKLTEDPTPIEVEMAEYEKSVNDSISSTLNNKQK